MELSIKPDWQNIYKWAVRQTDLLMITFEDIIKNPKIIALQLELFAGVPLNTEKMADTIIERSTDCYPTLLEFKMI